MGEGLRSLPTKVQLTEVKEGSESFPAESKIMNFGEGSSLLPTKIQATKVKEGSRLGFATGMDELINISQSIKNRIYH